ncbi:MAG: lysylphosphatidylglycerol synthase transmembrane domain-containing protein [Candidatus Latescibacterota bacterium]|nr:lysylphosphatidylglycerol synthase transmembrane domain-containing protein [Candidatus Latescibacterota bacterium]
MKTFLRLLLSLVLTGLFLYWAFSGLDLGQIWRMMRSTSLSWIAIITITTLGTLLLRAWRWIVFLRPTSPQVTLFDATAALTVCYAANFAVPRAGEALRAVSLRWSKGVSVPTSIATVVVERVIDMVWLILFVGVALLLVPSRIEVEFPWIEGAAISTLAACSVLLAVLVTAVHKEDRGVALVDRPLRRLSGPLADRVSDMLRKFTRGLDSLKTPGSYVEIIISSCLLNLGYVALVWESFYAFGFDADPGLGFDAAVVIMAIAGIGMVAPAAGGGAGSYHYFFGHSLHALFEVPEAAALACATLMHASANIIYLSLGVPCFFLQRRRATNDTAEPEADAK